MKSTTDTVSFSSAPRILLPSCCFIKKPGSLDAAVIDIRRLVFCAPEQDSNFAPVHKNEALGLVGDVGAEAATHNTVPGGQVHLIKLGLNDLCDIVQDAPLLESECYAVDSMLLHRLVHVC